MKTKPLRPSLRENKRYVVYEVLSKADIEDPSTISKSIQRSFQTLGGQISLGEAGLMFVHYDARSHRGIVRVKNSHVDMLKGSLLFIEKIENKNVILRSVGVSGILNKAKKKWVCG